MSLPHDSSETSPAADKTVGSAVRHRNKSSQIDFDIEFFAHILQRNKDYLDVLRCQAQLLSRRGRHKQALEIDRRLVNLRPDDGIAHYNLACSLALLGRATEAVDALRDALALGYDDWEHLQTDPDLESLYNTPEFQEMLRALEDCL